MYKINKINGSIIFPDGFELLPPYNDERYYEYAKWVHEGNSPEEIEVDSLLAAEDIEVTPAQVRLALAELGVYDDVLGLMNDPQTPSAVKIKWEFTLSFRRNDQSVILMAKILGWKKEFLDGLFKLAASIK